MQKVVVFLVAALFAFACASSKKVVDASIGAWEYTISGTPEGDISGTMVIAKDADTYTGYLENSQGRMDLNDVKVEDGSLSAKFDYMGYAIDVSGLFEGTAFDGKVSVEYNDFPMKATKKE